MDSLFRNKLSGPGRTGRRVRLPRTTLIALLIASTKAWTTEVAPFPVTNLNPFAQIFGLTFPASVPAASDRSDFSVSLQQEISNSFSLERQGAETLLIDGELWKTSLRLGKHVTENWHLSLTLPFLRHSKGFMDGLISDWHDWFGFPNGDREERPANRLLYYYGVNERSIGRTRQTQQGVGDVGLSLTHSGSLRQYDIFSMLSLKLPSGRLKRFTGSGGTDMSVSLLARDRISLADYKLTWFGGGGLAYLSAADGALHRHQNHWVWMTRLGGGWQATPAIQLKAQLDHHTAVYDSNLRALGKQALQLTAGVSWLPATGTQVDLSFSEDLITTVTPDISFMTALHYRF